MSLSGGPPETRTGRRGSTSSRPDLTPPAQRACRDTSRPCGACSDACGRTGRGPVAARKAHTAPMTIPSSDAPKNSDGFAPLAF